MREKPAGLMEFLYKAKYFFESLHPIVVTLLLMLMVSVPITLVSSTTNKGVNRENKQDIEDFFKENKFKDVALDTILKTPLKEEAKYRGTIAIVSSLKYLNFFKNFITFENPIVWFIIILPGIDFSQGHAIPLAALFDSLLLGWLVFKIGGWRGWLAAFLVHAIVNLSVTIGFGVNLLIK
jgi:ribose/xylose/arabinose/galactoside ABC-type transport system permease subunit